MISSIQESIHCADKTVRAFSAETRVNIWGLSMALRSDAVCLDSISSSLRQPNNWFFPTPNACSPIGSNLTLCLQNFLPARFHWLSCEKYWRTRVYNCMPTSDFSVNSSSHSYNFQPSPPPTLSPFCRISSGAIKINQRPTCSTPPP